MMEECQISLSELDGLLTKEFDKFNVLKVREESYQYFNPTYLYELVDSVQAVCSLLNPTVTALEVL
jgi:hypothetical protein